MRALSIRQPWAWLIVNGYKPIENRDWSTSWRGEFLVHAGKVFDAEAVDGILDAFPQLEEVLPQAYDLGGVVGVAELVDVVQTSSSRWFMGPYGFSLAKARPLELYPFRGALGFFDVPLTPALSAALGRPSAAELEAAGQGRFFG